ncbi:MAG: DUF362 domain-containing protein [Actinomycetota bacterium]|nr:DUF362 domain-containing protein [Actinomycetota bacterium]
MDPDATLPAKFHRLLNTYDFKGLFKDKMVALKMHMGRGIGYTTIHPLFIKILIKHIKEAGGEVFITDVGPSHRGGGLGGLTSRDRGYSEDVLGAPIYPVSGVFDKYYYSKKVDFKDLKEIQIAGNIHDAEVMIDLSHFKGHILSSFGGALKNIAMGCVTTKTRADIHSLHAGGNGITWDESLCDHCYKCVDECRYKANFFNDENRYEVILQDCTYCKHCIEICPNSALKLESTNYLDFQEGMVIATEEVLNTFEPGNIFYINILLNITFICDCWGMSAASVIPDIGILASNDIVAIDKASLDLITVENFNPKSLPKDKGLREGKHLFEQIWSKDPYAQIEIAARRGLGNTDYTIEEIK